MSDAPADSTGADVPVFSDLKDDEKTMGLLAHLLGIVLGFIGPLIIWLIKKDDSPFVDDQGKESLNFQLTLLIGWVIAVVTSCFFVGVILALLLTPIQIILPIIGGLKAKDGIAYRYPWRLALIK